MSATTVAATPAAEAVARSLAAHPDGITARDLATAASVGNSTAAKTLTAMEKAGTATRAPGTTNGRKTADIWRPATTTEEATVTTTDEIPATDTPATTDEAPATDTPATTDEAPAATGTDAAGAVAPVSGAPAPGKPSGADHFKIVMVAGILGGYPDGVSAADVIDQSGLRAPVVAKVLNAMEAAGAAVRKPGANSTAPELWMRGEGDLSTVNLADAAPYRECVCQCGHRHRVRTGGGPVTTRRTGAGRTTGETNSDGSAKLAKNGLRNQVEAFLRDLGTGHEVSPGTVARELGGRSSGAVLNAMARLSALGVLTMTSEAPVRYALTDNPPAPTADVLALMTTAPAADTDGDTPDSNTTEDAPATDEAPADPTTGDETTSDGAPATETTPTDAPTEPTPGDVTTADGAPAE